MQRRRHNTPSNPWQSTAASGWPRELSKICWGVCMLAFLLLVVVPFLGLVAMLLFVWGGLLKCLRFATWCMCAALLRLRRQVRG